MGKPEGSKMREMKPPIHTMFTVGHKVGSKRLISDAAGKEFAVQSGIRYCESCGEFTTKGVCPTDGTNTVFQSHEWISPTNDYKELYPEVSAKVLWEKAKVALSILGGHAFLRVGVGCKSVISHPPTPWG